MSVLWRPRARDALLAAIDYLQDRNETAAAEMSVAVEEAASLLSRMPNIARASRYPDCRAWSLTKWSKLIVFREMPQGIEIVAFLDTRQRPPEKV